MGTCSQDAAGFLKPVPGKKKRSGWAVALENRHSDCTEREALVTADCFCDFCQDCDFARIVIVLGL